MLTFQLVVGEVVHAVTILIWLSVALELSSLLGLLVFEAGCSLYVCVSVTVAAVAAVGSAGRCRQGGFGNPTSQRVKPLCRVAQAGRFGSPTDEPTPCLLLVG
ncbi:hypothetical protein V6N13_092376 [Hibiscus sabdariffa]|uniref:Secreted protein n=1 Tax=Hibiscus sabdariffa TaxID=183260 RepID=A0ABR2CD06_9ROSI